MTFEWIKDVLDGNNPQVMKAYSYVLPYICMANVCWYAALGNFVKDSFYNIYDRISNTERV
jgi:hypothetical protein